MSDRPKFFDFIDAQGWPLPVGLRVDESQGFFDLIVDYEDEAAAM